MKTSNFKNIVGDVKPKDVAVIKFFGKVTEESTRIFNQEFEYLEKCIQPSLIQILINCEGGSVLHGMTTYSTISNSTVPTECINEGLAASMGSVIWAAGDKSLMRDYSILMIHNPFLPNFSHEKTSDMVKAFTKQIETIYKKRFGLKADNIREIMHGKEGQDGTFFDADAAIKAGIIPKENILRTCKQLCDKIKNETQEIKDITLLSDYMDKIVCELNEEQPNLNEPDQQEDTPNQTNLSTLLDDQPKTNTMNDEKHTGFEISAVAASLGFKEEYKVKDVMAKLTHLISVEAKLDTTTKELKDAKTVIAGKDAALQNLQKDLDGVTAQLQTYQTKEAEILTAKREALIQNAIEDGKIEKDTKDQWLNMAESNYELVENTLASIPAREKITDEIANDPANIGNAKEAAKTFESEMAERVQAVVGANFEFKTLD